MTKLAQIAFENGKWVASFAGQVLASSKNKEYVVKMISSGKCARANELGVSDVETTDFAQVARSSANTAAAQIQQAQEFSINERFEFVEQLVSMIATKNIPSMIITGEGGLGKTFTVMKTLKANGKKDTRDFLMNDDEEEDLDDESQNIWTKAGDYTVIKGYSTPKGLYRSLFENRNKIVVLDDCDSVLKDPIALNLLKGALDSFDERWISWNAEMPASDELPRSFRFQGQVVFITNMPMGKIDQAIRSRSTCVDLAMTKSEKVERMGHIAREDDFMPEFELSVKEAALTFLEEHGERARELSLRTLISVVKIAASGNPNWTKLAKYVIGN